MSMFDQKPGGEPSAEAELATLQAEATQQPEPGSDSAQHDGSAAAPDAVEPEAGNDGDPGDDTRQVPLSALKLERSKRRALEERLTAFNEQMEALAHQHQQAQMQPPQEGPPDPEHDPIGALRYERQQREHLQHYLQSQALEQRVAQDYVADAQRFAAQTPDFADAYNHLFAGRVAELRAQGWHDDAIRGQVQREEFNIALGALRAGRSPAQQAYELAKARGYARGAGRAASASTDPTLAALKARAAASISEGGTPPRSNLSLEEIGRLSGPAFDAAFERYTRAQGKRSSLFRND
ncbi:hypothetical protein [Reyranella sp. CPCC 100927]|uniref:hypothetical protein n=1 Tax=Reyranella sp. CPCC 100927 TaxID=2599616 RepID=UPI0011B82F6F|nr:hypothetical protein [Reyranella sp. CPCC 100927]TWT11691.1 hypothetical protein FQU96_14545 [Reyranella sp. CPCC 100927]